MIETEHTYPPEIAEYREHLLRLMAEHRAGAAEMARKAPRFARQFIDTAELELCAIHGELLKLELFAVTRMIVTGDDIAKIRLAP